MMAMTITNRFYPSITTTITTEGKERGKETKKKEKKRKEDKYKRIGDIIKMALTMQCESDLSMERLIYV